VARDPRPPAVYVHVPFCAQRCDYCDFATWTDRGHLIDAYVDACAADLRGLYRSGTLPPAPSVFFGGGTPSLLDGDQLVRILDAVPRTADAEVTVECNPDSVDARKLDAYRSGGVNRLSFGVQSLRPHVLRALGRTHDPDNVVRALAAARAAGFRRINVDLIFGSAGETLDDWATTVDGVVALGPTHVSAYALTVVPSTPLGHRVAAGVTAAPDDDDLAARYELVDARLEAAGLAWYEISNWAVPGEECRHNLHCWDQGDYLAIGCAAHGHRAGERWWNVRTPERYVDAVRAGVSRRAGSELLSDAERAEERVALALRTRRGARVGAAAGGVVRELIGAGLARTEGGAVVLTRRGRFVADDVTARLLLAISPAARAPTPLALGTLEC
jgi:oxygen-independent coproporphyrinogen-3 oxidase